MNNINENSFWVNDQQKDEFEKSPTRIGNSFWINFLGFAALYDMDKENTFLKQYLNQKVMINSVDDKSGDLMLIIKILLYKNLIKGSVANEMTRFLARLKKRTDDKINQVLLRKMVKKVPVSKVKVSAKLKPFVTGFIRGEYSLEEIIDPFYNFARLQKNQTEFRRMARKIKTTFTQTDFGKGVTPPKAVIPTKTKTKTPPSDNGSMSGTPDFYKNIVNTIPADNNFPFNKNNKDLAKLFLLKFVNGKHMFRINPKAKNYLTHLKKMGTTAQEVMDAVSEKDFEDMYNNGFPKNHPELKYYYDTNPSLFRPISNKLWNDYYETERFYGVFPYKFWLKQRFKNRNIDFNSSYNSGNTPADIKILDDWKIEDLKDLQDDILLASKKALGYSTDTFLQKLETYKTINKFVTPLLYSEKDFIFAYTKEWTIKNILGNDFSYKWLEGWYKMTSQANKDMLKSKLYMFDMLDGVKFIKVSKLDKGDLVYTAFKTWVSSQGKSNSKKFDGIDVKSWLNNNGKMNQFKKDFETEEFDKVCLFSSAYGSSIPNFLDSINDFILNRKRKFTFGNQNEFNQFMSASRQLKKLSIYNSLMDDHVMPYLLNSAFVIDRWYSEAITDRVTEKNFIDVYDNHIHQPCGAAYLNIKNVSIVFIEKHKEKIFGYIEKDREDAEHRLYQLVYNEKDWIMFDGKDIDRILNSKAVGWRRGSMQREYFEMIVSGHANKRNPKDKWKSCNDYLTKFYKENINELKGQINNGSNLKSPEFIEYIVKNFKEELRDQDDTVRLLSINPEYPELLFALYDNDEDAVAEAFTKPDQILQGSRVIAYLKNFKDLKNIIKIMNGNKSIIENVTSQLNMPTLLTDYNFLSIVENGLQTLNVRDFDKLIDSLFVGKKLTTAVNGIRQKILSSAMIGEIYDDKKSLIQPIEKLTQARIQQVLRFNNVSIKLGPGMRRKKNESLKPYLNRIRKNTHLLDASEPLHIDKIEESEEQLEIKSAEYMKYYNFNHGNTAIEFLESFNVDMVNDEHKLWVKEHPTPTVIPAFHGTGSIGASMILRYGFKVLKSSDKSVVGRMLGDGIYVSNIIEKAAQYIGDNGFGRTRGTIGYILETDCYLGEKGKHYSSAGTGNDRILSPEYCLFDARSQIKIVKAHKVRMTSKNHIKSLKNKYKDQLKDSHYFDRYEHLLESKQPDNLITYIWYDGNVIDHNEKLMPFEDFEDKYGNNKNVFISKGQLGPEINIRTSADVLGSVHIPSAFLFKEENPDELYHKYLTILTNAIEDDEYKE